VDFSGLITRAGITKAELARLLGITSNAVSKWGDNPPRYAVAYLELLIEFNRVRP
jgi:predicted transcriptional regulator